MLLDMENLQTSVLQHLQQVEDNSVIDSVIWLSIKADKLTDKQTGWLTDRQTDKQTVSQCHVGRQEGR